MAYSLPLVAPSIFILKLKLHCTKCKNKLKRMLLAVQGVHSVNIDSKQGTVVISGTVEPSTIMMFLEKGLGRKAELLWDQSPSISNQGKNLQIIAESRMVDERFNDPDVAAQLQQLSGIEGRKNVEVTYFKTIKLTFEGQEDDSGDKTMQDGVYSPQICHGSGISGKENTYCPYACAPPPTWAGYSPSAPPLGNDTLPPPPPPPPPPAMGYPYSSLFSDDNPSASCNIM